MRVNSELLDWGPEVQPVGACPFEGFQNEPYEYTCNESELNSMCVGTRNGENDQHAGIYPMRICRRGFHGPPCDKPSATAKVGGLILF